MSFFGVFQAPNNMKAVLQAGWLLTVAIGNFIVLIVAEVAKIPEQVKKKKKSTSQLDTSDTSVCLCHVDNDPWCITPMFLPRLFKWAEYILFASLLIVVCVIFSIMAYFYTYINPAEIEAQFMKKGDDDDEDDKKQLQKGMEMVRRNSTGSHSDDDDDDERKKTKMWTKRVNVQNTFTSGV